MYLKNHSAIDNADIRIRLVNGSLPGALLQNYPHRKFLDLAAFCVLPGEENGGEGIFLDRQDAGRLGMTPGRLLALALDNTKRNTEFTLQRLSELLGFPAEEPAERERVYVLTNRKRMFGACAMLFDSVLEEAGEKLGGDYYLLPASVHECLVLRKSACTDPAALKALVYRVNRTEVNPAERLSDSIYLYETEKKALSVDISGSLC